MPFELPDSQPSEDSSNLEESWRALEAELMGKDRTADGFAAARRDMLEQETRLRRFELKEKIFVASDLLTRAPADFPDRDALLRLLLASEQLSDPLLARDRGHQLQTVLAEVRQVLRALEKEAAAPESRHF